LVAILPIQSCDIGEMIDGQENCLAWVRARMCNSSPQTAAAAATAAAKVFAGSTMSDRWEQKLNSISHAELTTQRLIAWL
jgi:hypothetical protein